MRITKPITQLSEAVTAAAAATLYSAVTIETVAFQADVTDFQACVDIMQIIYTQVAGSVYACSATGNLPIHCHDFCTCNCNACAAAVKAAASVNAGCHAEVLRSYRFR